MKKPCNLAEGVVRFRVNNNIKKELQIRIRKKKKGKERKGKVEQSVTYGIGLERKMFGSCNMMYNVTCSDTDA